MVRAARSGNSVCEPFAEQLLELQRQSQQDVGRLGCTCFVGRGEDALDLAVVDGGHDGCRHHRDGHAGCAQRFDGLQAPLRRRRPRLHFARDPAVQRRHRDCDLDDPPLRHPRQDVHVAHHQRRLRDDADGMRGSLQHLEQAARDAMLALDRLVGVGDGAERDHLGHVAWPGQLALQQLGGVHLGVELGLEVEARRVPEIAVGRPRKTVDAAVLAAAVGVDRLVEADIRAVVGRYDALGRLAVHNSLEGLELGQAFPAVVEGLAQLALEPPDPVRSGAPAAAPFPVDQSVRSDIGDVVRRGVRLVARITRRPKLEFFAGLATQSLAPGRHEPIVDLPQNKARTKP